MAKEFITGEFDAENVAVAEITSITPAGESPIKGEFEFRFGCKETGRTYTFELVWGAVIYDLTIFKEGNRYVWYRDQGFFVPHGLADAEPRLRISLALFFISLFNYYKGVHSVQKMGVCRHKEPMLGFVISTPQERQLFDLLCS